MHGQNVDGSDHSQTWDGTQVHWQRDATLGRRERVRAPVFYFYFAQQSNTS